MSIPITIISGFLGAGKTTFLQQILKYHSDLSRILIIENDFGQVNFDTQLLGTTGVNIRELTSGCICCSLQGDFKTALLQTLDQLDVDAIYIETSGVGKLSDILSACERSEITAIAHVQAAITIIDATNAPLFIRNFGEFFKDQVAHGDALFLTHQELPEQVELTINLLRELNPSAPIHTEDWADINVLEYITESLQPTVDAEETCHSDHHHEHNHECCHEHNSAHHHGNNADHVFSTFSFTDIAPRSEEQWANYFKDLPSTILRAKGVLPTDTGNVEIQHGLNHTNITPTELSTIGLTVISTDIHQAELANELCHQ